MFNFFKSLHLKKIFFLLFMFQIFYFIFNPFFINAANLKLINTLIDI